MTDRLSRRDVLRRGAAAAGVALAGGALPRGVLGAGEGEGASSRPNIVYMMTDDQRFDGFSFMGNKVVETPNLDRLARGGAVFENMFVTNSLCAPSRASFLTGKYSSAHGVKTNRSTWKDQPIFTDHLREAGYHTCFIGKAHRGAEVLKDKFDLWLGYQGQGNYTRPRVLDFEGRWRKPGAHMTDVLAERAVEYLREHRKDPFCMLLWFKSPHRAWDPAKRHRDLYKDKTVPEPPTFKTDYAGKPEAVKRTEMQVEIAKGKTPFQEWVKDYYRTIAGVDEAVGRVLKTLDELKLSENTIVVFTSDNGFFLGEHHFFDKRLMYEPSLRIPMLIRWPGAVKPGSRIDEMCLNVDLAPTLLEAAGLTPPERMHGRSWVPLLRGRCPDDWRKAIYYEYFEYPAVHMVRPNRGVRTERWKYIEYPAWEGNLGQRGRGRTVSYPAEYELYDLETDPHEATNLYGRQRTEQTVAALRKEMARLRKELGIATD